MHLFSWAQYVPFSLFFFHNSMSFYIAESPLMQFNDQVRQRHLYTGNKRQGLFLEMIPDGSVRGSPIQTAYTVLELRSVKPGETVIRGLSSSLYLCVDINGHLRGQWRYTEEDCTFRELLLADGYTIFLSPHEGLPISLTPKLSGRSNSPQFFQFLPVQNTLFTGIDTERNRKEGLQQPQETIDLNSHDPFGMELESQGGLMHSPGFLRRR